MPPATTNHARAHLKAVAANIAVLIVIAKEPKKLSEVASAIGITTGGLTGTADRMEQLGLAERIPTEDRRVQLLGITPNGAGHLRHFLTKHNVQD